MQWELALFLLHEMEQEGLEAPESVCVSALRVCNDLNQSHRTGELKAYMKGRNIDATGKSVDVTKFEEGHHLALAVLEMMGAKGVQPTKGTLMAAIEACSWVRNWEPGMALVYEAASAEDPTGEDDPTSLPYRIHEYAKVGRWRKAIKLLEETKK